MLMSASHEIQTWRLVHYHSILIVYCCLVEHFWILLGLLLGLLLQN